MAHMKTVRLIGAPTDVGASVRGAGMGPDALRVAGVVEALGSHKLGVIDQGNLAGPPNPWTVASGGLRNLQEVVAWNRSVFDAVARALGAGEVPLLMGGDHCLAIGSISAVARHCRLERKNLRVIWLDAHADVNTEAISPSGNLHGMPVACLLGHGPDALVGWSAPRSRPRTSNSSASAVSMPRKSRPFGCSACRFSTCGISTSTACATP
jgi:arginase